MQSVPQNKGVTKTVAPMHNPAMPTLSEASTNKGKGHTTPSLSTMDYEYALNYDDEEENSVAAAKATDSHTARKVWAVLQGSIHIPTSGGAGNLSSEGRVEYTSGK